MSNETKEPLNFIEQIIEEDIENSKHGGGAFGLLTGGRYTREAIYTETLVIALVPFTNKLYEKE